MNKRAFRKIEEDECEVCCEKKTQRCGGAYKVFSMLCDACLDLLRHRARIRYGNYAAEGEWFVRTDKVETYQNDYHSKEDGDFHEYAN
jgi:hypothetical protein